MTVTADLVGTVDQRGVFDVDGRAASPASSRLEEVDGEWRITNPPDGLIMLEPDFERLYDRRRPTSSTPPAPASCPTRAT